MNPGAAEAQRPAPLPGLLVAALQRIAAVHRVAWWTALATVAIGVLCAVAALVGPERHILGVNGWIKPAKFASSFGVYVMTVLWLLSFVEGRPRAVARVALVTGWGSLFESAAAALQVVRGTTSHFNIATLFDNVVFTLMGFSIAVVMIAALVLTFGLTLQKNLEPVFRLGLKLGLVVSMVGMLIGGFMLPPRPEQLALGPAITTVGSHAVGVPDGGPGLPVVNWSTEGGDLRAPHFAGLHGAQLLPLLAWTLGRRRSRLSERRRKALVWIAALTQVGIVAVLLAQALRGEPVLAPSGMIAAALAAVVGLGVASAASVLLRRHPGP